MLAVGGFPPCQPVDVLADEVRSRFRILAAEATPEFLHLAARANVLSNGETLFPTPERLKQAGGRLEPGVVWLEDLMLAEDGFRKDRHAIHQRGCRAHLFSSDSQ
ncbi:hypothetical protein ROR02_27400 [Pararhodospirillum oryzae]|uniref:Uncharacterized protein n=1 Tax=Pararhodospirillum oryzae TaxID=478448 RepID=A0A512HAY6_9PROT|nr:hypothetical protein ROR02_27400 [Pararhodospirillum oryzae]